MASSPRLATVATKLEATFGLQAILNETEADPLTAQRKKAKKRRKKERRQLKALELKYLSGTPLPSKPEYSLSVRDSQLVIQTALQGAKVLDTYSRLDSKEHKLLSEESYGTPLWDPTFGEIALSFYNLQVLKSQVDIQEATSFCDCGAGIGRWLFFLFLMIPNLQKCLAIEVSQGRFSSGVKFLREVQRQWPSRFKVSISLSLHDEDEDEVDTEVDRVLLQEYGTGRTFQLVRQDFFHMDLTTYDILLLDVAIPQLRYNAPLESNALLRLLRDSIKRKNVHVLLFDDRKAGFTGHLHDVIHAHATWVGIEQKTPVGLQVSWVAQGTGTHSFLHFVR